MSVTPSTHAKSRDAHPLAGLPRLLHEMPAYGAMSFFEHQECHGQFPLVDAHRRARSDLIEELARAGLRGRGGAGFHTATKLRAVASARRGRPVVAINATEGEPMSSKDHTLVRALPHLVLDGGEITARALGTSELIVSVCESDSAGLESLAMAIAERDSPAGHSSQMRLTTVPDRYVAGQETALIAHLNGAPAVPTFTPPMPYERGVSRRPTLLSNAETFAHIALIARHGASWFRQLGTSTQPGSALVTLSGPLARPGVYEIEYGVPLKSLIDAAGGTTATPRAVLFGGYCGSWVDAAHLNDLVLSERHLESYGASLGAGVVTLLSEYACPIAETTRLVRWLADQSARQCGPCMFGLQELAGSLEAIIAQSTHIPTRERIAELTMLVRRRGACAHPDGVASLVESALVAFKREFAEHARRGACERCHSPAELYFPNSK